MKTDRCVRLRATGSLVALLWLVGGCGGTDGSATDGGGSLGATRGNLSFLVEGCGTYAGGIGADLGVADIRERAAQLPASDGSRPGRLIEDGNEGARVGCTVSGGAPHLVDVQITGNQTSPSNPVDEVIGMTLTDGWIDSGGVGEATISLQAGGVHYQTSSETVCTLTTESAIADNQFSVAAGRIYARFDCPDLVDPPRTGCTAVGAFALEACDDGG